MSDSDEDRLLLEDESMDEMYEIDDTLQVSIDTNASLSPVKRNGHYRKENDSDRDGSDSDSDDDDETNPFGSRDGSDNDSDASSSVEMPSKLASISFDDAGEGRRAVDADLDEDSDEPPEIPGSPMAAQVSRAASNQPGGLSAGRMNRLSEADTGRIEDRSGALKPNGGADILRVHIRDDDDRSSSGADDEYVVRDTEQPRSTEFHASSSSESDEDEGSDDSENDDGNQDFARRRSSSRSSRQMDMGSRPKTAAKDLECYRDVIPDEFFQQIGEDRDSHAVPSKNDAGKKSSGQQGTKASSSGANSSLTDTASTGVILAEASRNQSQKYAVSVPQEVENLFQLIDAYTPEEIEIGTRLEPFVPDYIPTIGLPFDGIQIPRPDGKIDRELGIQVLKEPSSSSNVAELELLMAAHLKNQRKTQHKTSFVHSIEDAEHRPKEIDQWIESVAKVQSCKPSAQVVYKKPMPSLEALMELWPEEMEAFLAQNPQTSANFASSSLSTLDVNLDELVKIVCVLLDIPVYEGSKVQSLHLLLRVYHEIEGYEREMAQQQADRCKSIR